MKTMSNLYNAIKKSSVKNTLLLLAESAMSLAV